MHDDILDRLCTGIGAALGLVTRPWRRCVVLMRSTRNLAPGQGAWSLCHVRIRSLHRELGLYRALPCDPSSPPSAGNAEAP